MQILHPPSFLVLGLSEHYDPPSISITPDFSEVIANWKAGTRCSPVWRIQMAGATPSDRFDFKGEQLLILLGPVQLASLCSDIKEVNDPNLFIVWVSAGTLNVLLQANNNKQAGQALSSIKRWALAKKLALEHWIISNGRVKNGKVQVPEERIAKVPESLRELANITDLPLSVNGALQEYCALMASALSRSRALLPSVHDDLVEMNGVIVKEVNLFKDGTIRYIDIYLRLLNINAALSRFTSQAFSGIPPVIQTECHYWVHSLLGTGSANIAISRLATHIRRTLGEARIPERLAAMETRLDKVPSFDDTSTKPEFLRSDHLAQQELKNGTAKPLPLITYFSGRDGFSSHIYTLSAPLTTIAECNSLRSSLLTITHELSHIQIRGVLSVVYPNIDDDKHIALAAKILTPKYQGKNWLEAAKQLVLEGIVSLEQDWNGTVQLDSNELGDPAATRQMLRRWRREAQEILVHAFDFLYFYSAKSDVYISSIWHSWCAIPGIADRVPEYVIRTLCATGSEHLHITDSEERLNAIRAEALDQFRKVKNAGGLPNGDYVDQAIEQLEHGWMPNNGTPGIRSRLRAGLLLTRFVRAFLFSETFAAKIYSDPYIASARVKESGYAKKRNQYDLVPIGNPLRFLSENIKESPSETDSLWVLHNLAFNSAADE